MYRVFKIHILITIIYSFFSLIRYFTCPRCSSRHSLLLSPRYLLIIFSILKVQEFPYENTTILCYYIHYHYWPLWQSIILHLSALVISSVNFIYTTFLHINFFYVLYIFLKTPVLAAAPDKPFISFLFSPMYS